MSNSVTCAVAGFVSLVSKGWETGLAIDCMYDTVYDEIKEDDFILLCQREVFLKYQYVNN